MASGDTKTQQYLDIAARGTRADLQRGCCNTRTQDLIMDVAERIITEEETRAAADQVLQSEIDEIKNNPDVFDIVPTYAALQAYDTSTITDKDVIRVLRDETHDNASTYYRWDAANQEFDYIGETGDYYTKAQVNALLALKADKATTYTKTETDALLAEKQDNLIAGANIQIAADGKTISATDTTYNNFVGTDGTAAGQAGLVPAPTAADAGKVLGASGLWEVAQSGGGVTELTSADYNYPTNNPNSVALWKLDEGLYSWDTSIRSKIKISTIRNANDTTSDGALVMRPSTADSREIYLFGDGDTVSTSFGRNALHFYKVTTSTGVTTNTDNIFFVTGKDLVSSTGNSTTSAMSQYGATKMIYYDTNDKTMIQIGAGANASMSGVRGVAIGQKATANGASSIALGSGATTPVNVKGVMSIGSNATGHTTNGYNNSQYRLLSGLYDPQSAHDAATKGYVDGLVGNVASALNAINNGTGA